MIIELWFWFSRKVRGVFSQRAQSVLFGHSLLFVAFAPFVMKKPVGTTHNPTIWQLGKNNLSVCGGLRS
jgi:hypothetical protein